MKFFVNIRSNSAVVCGIICTIKNKYGGTPLSM